MVVRHLIAVLVCGLLLAANGEFVLRNFQAGSWLVLDGVAGGLCWLGGEVWER